MKASEGNSRPRQVNVDHATDRLRELARVNRFQCEPYGFVDAHPLLALHRSAALARAPTVYLSAGIHGDEPAGPLAVLHLLNRRALSEAVNWWIFPLMNPTGFGLRQRENQHGVDLNRAYHRPTEDATAAEVAAHRSYLDKHLKFLDLGLYLHEDWEATGTYLYEINFSTAPSLATTILAAAGQFTEIEAAEQIDGHEAAAGIIRPKSVPTIPAGLPESLYLHERFKLDRGYTLETPSSLPVATRVQALATAVEAAVASLLPTTEATDQSETSS